MAGARADGQADLVDADIHRARSLPPEVFTDPAFLDRELATIFRSSWLLLPQREASQLRDDPRALADLVRRRGARAPVSLLDRPFFLQRDWKGKLHLFPNVCTHAWHTLVAGPDRDRVIVCPQHGRRFDTTGRFVSQPGFEGVPDFPQACDHLADMPVAEWGEMLFACLGEPHAPFRRALAPVQRSVERLPFARMARRPFEGEVRELDGNWKQHAWNYMDALHIPYIHSRPGGLSEAVDLASYRTELVGSSALQWAYARDPAHGFDRKLLPKKFARGDKRVFALWWFVFPNLTLNVYPWGLSINQYMPVPGEPQRTRFHWYHFVWDAAKYERRDEIWMMHDVDAEDVDALTQVARGVRSGLAVPGRFAPKAEKGPHWFHRLVCERMTDDAPAVRPKVSGTRRAGS